MIKVDRQSVNIPDILTNPKRTGLKETTKAINYYANPNVLKPFKFSAYSKPEVKSTLINLFKEKCAYCESRFLHVYSGDVEHFRPKGQIAGIPNPKPGYYWLAAHWDNLLLSCRNCNQKLKHLTVGNTKKITMGKMDQFPLLPQGLHVRTPNDKIEDEEPFRLLINPCKENPEDYFKYDIKSGVIIPKRKIGKQRKMADASIKVYVLQRVPLVQARERKSIEILAQIQRVKEAVKNVSDFIDNPSSVKKIYFDKILKKELKKLRLFLNPKEEYLGLARQVIKAFLKENFQISI